MSATENSGVVVTTLAEIRSVIREEIAAAMAAVRAVTVDHAPLDDA